MANPNKNKGDGAEREAVSAFITLCPDLVVDNPMRMLGAGRKDDIGDLRVIDGVAVQVKAWRSLSAAVYASAVGAHDQAINAGARRAVGMVLVPRARRVGAVRWVMCALDWPADDSGADRFGSGLAAFNAVKQWGPDVRDLAVAARKGQPTVTLGSLQTWVCHYRALLAG